MLFSPLNCSFLSLSSLTSCLMWSISSSSHFLPIHMYFPLSSISPASLVLSIPFSFPCLPFFLFLLLFIPFCLVSFTPLPVLFPASHFPSSLPCLPFVTGSHVHSPLSCLAHSFPSPFSYFPYSLCCLVLLPHPAPSPQHMVLSRHSGWCRLYR